MILDVTDGRHGPVRVALAALEVDLLGRVGALPLDGTVEAAVTGLLGLLLLAEVEEAAEALDLGALPVAHPGHDEVDVVAALGQQGEGGLVLVAPVSPDEAGNERAEIVHVFLRKRS